jgi:hypothetical protein
LCSLLLVSSAMGHFLLISNCGGCKAQICDTKANQKPYTTKAQYRSTFLSMNPHSVVIATRERLRMQHRGMLIQNVIDATRGR